MLPYHVLSILIAGSLLFGCAHGGNLAGAEAPDTAGSEPKNESDDADANLSGESTQNVVVVVEETPDADPIADIDALVDATPDSLELAADHVETPPIEGVPLVYNRQVQKYIDYFEGRGRERFDIWLQRSGTYIPVMEAILLEEGLPPNLVYLALIESGFSSHAYSHASAVGYWQFIAATGKRYGLRIDDWVDERRDPVKATRAAARYLKDLYGMFGDWHLAAAGYNAGEGRVKRAIKRTGSDDYWQIIRRRGVFAVETKEYVPKLMAAMTIAENPAKYGFFPAYHSPLNTVPVMVPGGEDLMRLAYAAGVSYTELKRLNPELRRWSAPPDVETYRLNVPPFAAEGFSERLAAVPEDVGVPFLKVVLARGENLSTIALRHQVRAEDLELLNPGYQGRFNETLRVPVDEEGNRYADRAVKRTRLVTHRVRRGDTLSGIAKRYRTSVRALKRYNGLRTSTIRLGQRIRVPVRGGGGAPVKQSGVHVVIRGDTLEAIAARNGTTVAAIKRANNLRSTNIRVGQRLSITGGSASNNSPTRYRVRRGDTLTQIARKYRLSPNRLAAFNGIKGDMLYAGQYIRIP